MLKKINDTTFEQTVKDDVEDRLQIEVGDSKQPDFKPQLKIMRWDNEVNFSIRAKEQDGATLEEKDGLIKYITTDYEVHQYNKPDASEEGGFEFEWVLNSKPESNVLTTTIQSKGLNFYYQPSLSQEEIERGGVMPDNVIGSYAVYHSTKANHKIGSKNYKAGKAFHIYRPKAIDANKKEIWCDLNINEGVLSVSVPQKFLDSAIYPIVIDPTIGYTTLGASALSRSGDDLFASNVSNSISGDVTFDSVSWGGTTLTGNNADLQGAIYDSSENLLSPQTEEILVDDSGKKFYTMNFTGGPSVSTGDYHPAGLHGYNGANVNIARDTGSSGDSKFNLSATYNSWPDPGSFSDSSSLYSVYATYTAGGGEEAIQIHSNLPLMGVG